MLEDFNLIFLENLKRNLGLLNFSFLVLNAVFNKIWSFMSGVESYLWVQDRVMFQMIQEPWFSNV